MLFTTQIVSRVQALSPLLIAFLVAVGPASVYGAEESGRVKALFLYNFANFAEWPEGAFSGPEDPIRLCLFGEVEFGKFIQEFEGAIVRNRQLEIIRTEAVSEIRQGCHILFVNREQKVRLPDFWSDIRYLYVLSIGEEEGFTSKGGIVNIVRTYDGLEFDINIETALANGLNFSSDVLSLARKIKRAEAVGSGE